MSTTDDVLAYAQLELGKPYVFGAEGPNTFDCSGLMQWVYGKVGISLPRTAHEQQNALPAVAQPRPGDLVFWGRPAYHVALYIGGGKVISAPKPGGKVQIEPVWGTPSGYGRVPGAGSALTPALGVITGAASSVGDVVGSVLGGAKHIVYEAGFVGLGLALIGLGVYVAVVHKGGTQ